MLIVNIGLAIVLKFGTLMSKRERLSCYSEATILSKLFMGLVNAFETSMVYSKDEISMFGRQIYFPSNDKYATFTGCNF
jgi:hypothetical protein